MHPNDPNVNDIDGVTDLMDRAHQRTTSRLLEGDTVCKVRIEDVFDSMIRRDRPFAIELLCRLCQLSSLHGETFNEEVEDLVRLAKQRLDDFVEENDHLVDAMAEEIQERERQEALDEGTPYYGEAA